MPVVMSGLKRVGNTALKLRNGVAKNIPTEGLKNRALEFFGRTITWSNKKKELEVERQGGQVVGPKEWRPKKATGKFVAGENMPTAPHNAAIVALLETESEFTLTDPHDAVSVDTLTAPHLDESNTWDPTEEELHYGPARDSVKYEALAADGKRSSKGSFASCAEVSERWDSNGDDDAKIPALPRPTKKPMYYNDWDDKYVDMASPVVSKTLGNT